MGQVELKNVVIIYFNGVFQVLSDVFLVIIGVGDEFYVGFVFVGFLVNVLEIWKNIGGGKGFVVNLVDGYGGVSGFFFEGGVLLKNWWFGVG